MAKQLPRSINLLEPTGEPLSTWDKIYDWVFRVGRYVIIAVEAVVVLAFISRFILDRKNNDLKESIEGKINLLDQQESFEEKAETLQVLLDNIQFISENQFEASDKLTKILKNIPSKVTLASFSMDQSTVKLVCTAPDYQTVNEMESNFKNDTSYGTIDVTLTKSGSANATVEFSFTVNFAEAEEAREQEEQRQQQVDEDNVNGGAE
jgi:Tfp pilus assembly protein PilN